MLCHRIHQGVPCLRMLHKPGSARPLSVHTVLLLLLLGALQPSYSRGDWTKVPSVRQPPIPFKSRNFASHGGHPVGYNAAQTRRVQTISKATTSCTGVDFKRDPVPSKKEGHPTEPWLCAFAR